MSAAFDDGRDLYQEIVLDRGRNPRNQRRLEVFDAAAKGDNPMCGDRVEVRLRLDGGRVAEAGFEARGCAISVASADLMTGAVAGRTPEEVRAMAARFRAMVATGRCEECGAEMEALKPLSGVHDYRSRHKCATLPWDAMLAALKGAGHD